MTTEPLALANKLNCHAHTERYQLDCLVRFLLTAGWPGAIAGGWASEQIEIEAGIGRLFLSAEKQIWTPTARRAPPQPQPAPPAQAQARQAICDQCTRYEASTCTVAGCGCAGQGVPGALLSKCPLGKW